MKYFYMFAALASAANSAIAFSTDDIGYALGLLGGAGAWVMISVATEQSH